MGDLVSVSHLNETIYSTEYCEYKIPSIINLRVILSVSFIRLIFTNILFILFIRFIFITDLSQN